MDSDGDDDDHDDDDDDDDDDCELPLWNYVQGASEAEQDDKNKIQIAGTKTSNHKSAAT